MNSIIERLKDIKSAKGLTNQQISDITGVPVGSINRLFANEETDPKWITVVKIASGLGLDLNLLAGMAKIEEGNQPPAPVARTVESIQFDMLLANCHERIEEMKAMHERQLHACQERLEKDIEIYKERLAYHKEIIADQKREKRFLAVYGLAMTILLIALFTVDFFIPNHGWIQKAIAEFQGSFLWKFL